MTEVPSGAANVELALARETLDAARLLAQAGFHRHAVGRAYYALFHGACALLASIGRTARTHEGVRNAINQHFVRPGVLALEHARALRQAAGDRGDADYDAVARFDEADSTLDINRAESFLVAVEQILAAPNAGSPNET